VSPVRRWPLHPPPGPVESLSSWLGRLATLHGLSVKDLLTHNLDLVDARAALWDPDYDPPAGMLAALAERTGVDLAQLKPMALAGWVPWLFDTLPARGMDEQALFDTYVRANSVLLAPGEASVHLVDRWKSWAGPWLPIPKGWLLRVCPACAADPDQGTALVWKLPLMVGCVEHGCWLENVQDVELSLALDGHPLAPRPVDEPLSTLDRYTHHALTTGRADLPGRSVHAGVWFRLLRSLLDEVSLAVTTLRAHGRTTLEQVWEATGRPECGGLTIWKPYEQLDWDVQEAMLHAAAVALHLAAERQITARGRLASTLAPPRLHVYDGDPPDPPDPVRTAWAEAMAQMEAAIAQARTDRDTAHQLLSLLTFGCRTLARFDEQRAYLFGIGIPAEFLPTARKFGRADLA
jgi:TniQ